MPVPWIAIVNAISDKPQAQFSIGSLPYDPALFNLFLPAVAG
jgi:hypothetical protein